MWPASPGEDGVDEASTAMLGQVNPERNASSFFGGSSVGCFLQQIQKMVKANPHSPDRTTRYSPLQANASRAQAQPNISS